MASETDGLTGEALREETTCSCGAGHGSGETHTRWCAYLTDSPAPIATPEEVAGISIDHYGENRTRLFFACPRRPGHRCSVLLKPWPIIGVPTWHWDGNEQAPTLTPSVNCVGGCGWHGFIQKGRLVDA